MISTSEAIRVARSKLGTPYGSGPGQLDCINLIKWVIRHSVGGDPSYTDAHVPALWASFESSGRYKHLTAQHIGIDGALPGMLAFKGKPWGHDREPSHVGLVSYDGKVIHASSAKGQVVETELDNGQWTLLGTSKWIQVGAEPEPEPEPSPDPRERYTAEVISLANDKPVNLRSGPSTSDRIIGKIPVGAVVDVLVELDGWDFIDTQIGQGYMASQYLRRIDPEPEPEPEPGPGPAADWMTDPIMISDTGAIVRLDGRWRLAID